MKIDWFEFARRLRDARHERGVSQEELAFRIGVEQGVISRFENVKGGESGQSTPIIIKLMLWAGIKAEDFTDY